MKNKLQLNYTMQTFTLHSSNTHVNNPIEHILWLFFTLYNIEKLRNDEVEQYEKMLQARFKLTSLALALKLNVHKEACTCMLR